ncbi:MAG TPA: AMP-binding protein [Acidimicrobiales bacterium]|nr:AMP-binding protein [Acidimicrobiales bacterium]
MGSIAETLGQFIDAALTRLAHLEVRVWSRTRPTRHHMADVHEMARHVAGGLRKRGVGPGDVVAFQMPNCVEAAALFYGTALLGAAVVPIVHFYGAKEVGFIEGDAQPALFLSQDDAGELAAGDDVLGEPLPTDPDGMALIAYTSGTTANPKGVIHTHRSIVSEVLQLSANQPKDPRPLLVGAPVGHAIGMLSGLLIPLVKERGVHLIDKWDPTHVLEAMVEGDLTAGSGSTFFLTSLLDAPEFGAEHLARMKFVGLGGSPVPAAVAERATALGISITRAYGSTEHPSTTGSQHEFPLEKRLYTDGKPLPGVELRLADDGEILSRGPDLFAGYTDKELTAEAVDAEGWYHSGDIGVLDDEGFLTITDRKKDVISRGGEKVSAVEVEEIIVRLPGVAEVAVVAAPDERMGEHGAAFFRMHPGASAPSLDDMRAALEDAGLARQKWPEEVHGIDGDFPRTPSGKIRKVDLRAQLRERG